MKKFYLYPYIYYTANASNEILLYNTKTGTHIKNSFPSCRQLIEDIYDPEKLGVIDFSEKYLNSNEVVEFVKQLTEENFGQLIDVKPGMPQLVNLLPILNLQDDVERLEKDKESDIGEKAIQYLNELNIYLNSQCSLNCPHCDLYFKQTKSCFKETKKVNIQTHKIKEILDGLAYSSLKKVNFLGGNILLYPYLNELTELLKTCDFEFHYWIHISNLLDTDFPFAQNIDVLINFPANTDSILKYIETHKKGDKITYHFLIENDSQYEETNLILNTTGINNYQITPIYTGSNISFFEDNVYLTKEDLFAAPVPHRMIFCNQKLNSNFFGKLYILPDGTVKANMNTDVLGNIDEDSLLKLIEIELNKNTAWRKVRNGKPCNDCLYQYLCPPPSNYETVLGKSYLCHIRT